MNATPDPAATVRELTIRAIPSLRASIVNRTKLWPEDYSAPWCHRDVLMELMRGYEEKESLLAKLAAVEKELATLRDSETQAHAEMGNMGPKLVYALARAERAEKLLGAIEESASHLIHCAKHFASDDREAPTEAHNLFYAVDDAEGDLEKIDAHLAASRGRG